MGIIKSAPAHEIRKTLLPVFQKYRIPILLLCCGLLLVCCTNGKKPDASPSIQQETGFSLEETTAEMEKLLSHVEGVGSVQVMLTLRTGWQSQYLQDVRTSVQQELETKEATTVLQSTTSASRTPVMTVQTYPQYQGAVIVCTGADCASVRLAVKEAVSSLTGLGSDKISVIKMKEQ